MAVPKKKTSKSKRDMRRAHDFLSRTFAVICPNKECGAFTLRHRVCGACGMYKGRQVLSISGSARAEA